MTTQPPDRVRAARPRQVRLRTLMALVAVSAVALGAATTAARLYRLRWAYLKEAAGPLLPVRDHARAVSGAAFPTD